MNQHFFMKARTARRHDTLALCLLMGMGVAALAGNARAGSTDIATVPLSSSATPVVKPNVMFILDDSGSMQATYNPDEANRSTAYAIASSHCNGLAFNPDPAQLYAPPLKADGSFHPNATFTAAWNDGFRGAANGTTDLTGRVYYTYSGALPDLAWRYLANGAPDTTATFYRECRSTVGSAPGNAVFTAVPVSAANQQRYANWYAYYRTRELLMRTAAGRAFQALGTDYRVGFTSISNTASVDGNRFLHVRDFDQTQKNLFFEKLYGVGAHSWTPLRGALSKVGQYFANKAPGQDVDPMQYSCQRNYAILSTDGYWNDVIETATYGPYKLDGSLVGQQDGDAERPMHDGAGAETVQVIDRTQAYQYPRTRSHLTDTPYTRNRVVVNNSTGASGCSATQFRVTTQPQARTVRTTQPQVEVDSTVTKLFRQIILTRSGILQSDTTSQVGGLTPAYSDTWNPNGAAANNNPTWSNVGGSGITCKTLAQLALAGTPRNSTTFSPDANGTPGSATVTTGGLTNPAVEGAAVGGLVQVSDTTTTSINGGSSNSLADVAQYYYTTDLRSAALGNCSGNGGRDVCDNTSLSPLPNDPATYQHLSTSTIGLGVSGTLTYDPDYLKQTSGAFINIKQGTANWPNTTGNSPGAEAIDDLWHAAVNGRGTYFATQNAEALAQAIQKSLDAVTAVVGSSSAAATTSLQPTAGQDNHVFIASFTTVQWTGDLKAFPLSAVDGTVDTANPRWSAAAVLDNTTPASRNIYYKAAGSNTLRQFTEPNLSADGYGGYFANFCSQPTIPSQCAGYSVNQRSASASAGNVVGYLRGERTLEAATGDSAVFRARVSTLGDIINSEPAYVQKPPFTYQDTGYAAHVSTWANRKPVIYVGSNDGMLHAFSGETADGGAELWAYVPTAVMPKMYLLGDKNYENLHQHRVDGTPVVADIYNAANGTWHTILIAGLNSGGRAYYALDVTNPLDPQMLWEYSHADDADLGLTYGNPVVAKRADGAWVVMFASGYNNIGAGDGGGHLYVLDAFTGARMLKISTGAGSTTTPSGLSKINAWRDSATDNTTQRVYGADLLGNVWRFDIDSVVAPHQSALLLAQLSVSGVPQPVTTIPLLTTVTTSGGSRVPVVSIGTGRYLGLSDLGDESRQSLYTIADRLQDSGHGDFRTNSQAVNETVSANSGGNSGTIGASSVDWSTAAGWYVDLPAEGERIVIDMSVANGSLVAISAIPGGTDCAPVGSSVLYRINLNTGSGAFERLGDFLVAGFSVIKVNSSGTNATDGVLKIVGVKGDSSPFTKDIDLTSGSGVSPQHRTSWRELVN